MTEKQIEGDHDQFLETFDLDVSKNCHTKRQHNCSMFIYNTLKNNVGLRDTQLLIDKWPPPPKANVLYEAQPFHIFGKIGAGPQRTENVIMIIIVDSPVSALNYEIDLNSTFGWRFHHLGAFFWQGNEISGTYKNGMNFFQH